MKKLVVSLFGVVLLFSAMGCASSADKKKLVDDMYIHLDSAYAALFKVANGDATGKADYEKALKGLEKWVEDNKNMVVLAGDDELEKYAKEKGVALNKKYEKEMKSLMSSPEAQKMLMNLIKVLQSMGK